MAVRPKRYESRGGRKIRAIKITEKNYVEILNWTYNNGINVLPDKSVAKVKVSAKGDESDHRLSLHLAGVGIRVARVGDYVAHVLTDDLRLTDGRLLIIKGDIFDDKYTEIKKA